VVPPLELLTASRPIPASVQMGVRELGAPVRVAPAEESGLTAPVFRILASFQPHSSMNYESVK
jgi:hypothetical protein